MLEKSQDNKPYKNLFNLTIEMDFCASHIIHGHLGKCARLHGHNWTVEAHVSTEVLDKIGIGIDFQDIKSALRPIIERLDHYHLNDLAEFQDQNPTAENVSFFIYWELRKNLPPDINLDSITLWETDRSRVSYQPVF